MWCLIFLLVLKTSRDTTSNVFEQVEDLILNHFACSNIIRTYPEFFHTKQLSSTCTAIIKVSKSDLSNGFRRKCVAVLKTFQNYKNLYECEKNSLTKPLAKSALTATLIDVK